MNTKTSSRRAFAITGVSALIGLCYFMYISTVSFPHDLARIVPFVWLIGGIFGLAAASSSRSSMTWYARALFFSFAALNILLAGIFSFGAVMGD